MTTLYGTDGERFPYTTAGEAAEAAAEGKYYSTVLRDMTLEDMTTIAEVLARHAEPTAADMAELQFFLKGWSERVLKGTGVELAFGDVHIHHTGDEA